MDACIVNKHVLICLFLNFCARLLQTAPLDFATPTFFSARRPLFESRLHALHSTRFALSLLRACWHSHHGCLAVGVNWDPHSLPLSLLQAVLCSAGGPAVAAICRQLAVDYRTWRSGMPDLTLWRGYCPCSCSGAEALRLPLPVQVGHGHRAAQEQQCVAGNEGGPEGQAGGSDGGMQADRMGGDATHGERKHEAAARPGKTTSEEGQCEWRGSTDAARVKTGPREQLLEEWLCRCEMGLDDDGKSDGGSGSGRKGELMLVEVKGPRDVLSRQQQAWLMALTDAEIRVEVCKVVEEE